MKPLFVACLLALSTGCGLVKFDVDQDIPADTIPGSTLPGLLPPIFDLPITIDLSAETEKRNTGPVSRAELKLLRLQITPHEAPIGNWDFLDALHVYAEKTSGTADKVEIGVLDPVPTGVTTIEVKPLGVDLLPYLQAGAKLTATATGTQPSQNTSYDGKVTVTLFL